MVNYHDRVQSTAAVFKQLFCKELLFIYGDTAFRFHDYRPQNHHALYIGTSKKDLNNTDEPWIFSQRSAVFLKKGTGCFKTFFDENPRMLGFFIPDEYLKTFVREHIHLVQKDIWPQVSAGAAIPLRVSGIMNGYYESMIPYFFAERKPSEDLLELKFRELLFHIITETNNRQLIAWFRSLLLPNSDNLQSVLEANYRCNLKLEDYARLCNRSLSSFKRDFIKVYGVSPGTWLTARRLSFAVNLLISTDKPVNEVSFESGFENSTHFSRVFKKQHGISPLQYRIRSRRVMLQIV